MLETGVERKGDVVCLQEPPRERGGSRISHSAYQIMNRTRVWTAIRKGSRLVGDEHRDVSTGANNNIIVSDVRAREDKITRIVHVYNQKDRQSGGRPALKLNRQRVIRQGGTVIPGHFNAHSSRWDSRCRLLARSDRREWTGNWKSWPTHTLLDNRGP